MSENIKYLELSKWQVDQKFPKQLSPILILQGKIFLNGVEQSPMTGDDYRIHFQDRLALIQFAREILEKIDPTTEQKILKKLDDLIDAD